MDYDRRCNTTTKKNRLRCTLLSNSTTPFHEWLHCYLVRSGMPEISLQLVGTQGVHVEGVWLPNSKKFIFTPLTAKPHSATLFRSKAFSSYGMIKKWWKMGLCFHSLLNQILGTSSSRDMTWTNMIDSKFPGSVRGMKTKTSLSSLARHISC